MKHLAIHHTAVSRKTQSSQLIPVDRYHKNKWNYKSSLGWFVGYNYFIDVNGSLTACRKIGEETMAQLGHNLDAISVCLAGNFNLELPTDAQNDRLRDFIDNMTTRYPDVKITYHRALQEGRVCPGKLFTDDYLYNVVLKTPIVSITDIAVEEETKALAIVRLSTRIDVLIALLKKVLLFFQRSFK